ncbi:Rieske (2Fe-2S) protein [Pseudonocardia xishanensis]|uniref:Rieske (2Fe-2S) protein n=1 Tax=Pseudonocardia xishanensis TaxID=630995 RepID=A0ABP8RT89_9PSEU
MEDTVEKAVAEHFVGRVEDLPLNEIHPVVVEGRSIGVIRTVGRVYAIGNRCPHQGAPMCAGRVGGTMAPSEPDEYVYAHDGLIVQCPWHAYEFHIDSGRSVAAATRGRVATYRVTVRDGDVFCTLTAPGSGGTP